jgi:hypothetical protein
MAVVAVPASPAPTTASHAHRRSQCDTAQPHGKEGAQSEAMSIDGKGERRRKLSGTHVGEGELTTRTRRREEGRDSTTWTWSRWRPRGRRRPSCVARVCLRGNSHGSEAERQAAGAEKRGRWQELRVIGRVGIKGRQGEKWKLEATVPMHRDGRRWLRV